MGHIAIEYVIMMPILITQIFLFPLAATWLMNIWVDSRRNLAVQDVAGHLGSAVQQLYLSLNHETTVAGKVTYAPGLPLFIEDYPYKGTANLLTTLEPGLNSSQVLDLTVQLISTKVSVTTKVVLGSNVAWSNSTFISNSTNACVNGEKLVNGTIRLSFGSLGG